jgi:hypothetical protein
MRSSTRTVTLLRVLAAWLHGELIVLPAAQGVREKRDGAQAWRRGTAAMLAVLGMKAAAKASGSAAESK